MLLIWFLQLLIVCKTQPGSVSHSTVALEGGMSIESLVTGDWEKVPASFRIQILTQSLTGSGALGPSTFIFKMTA